MTSIKHTPGPWVPLPSGSKKWVTSEADLGADPDAVWRANRDADAALVSAAPEMLDALKAITSFVRIGEPISQWMIAKAERAIAKAEQVSA